MSFFYCAGHPEWNDRIRDPCYAWTAIVGLKSLDALGAEKLVKPRFRQKINCRGTSGWMPFHMALRLSGLMLPIAATFFALRATFLWNRDDLSFVPLVPLRHHSGVAPDFKDGTALHTAKRHGGSFLRPGLNVNLLYSPRSAPSNHHRTGFLSLGTGG
jgi:hypothetical protein